MMETEEQNQEKKAIIEFATYIQNIQQLTEVGKKKFPHANQLKKLRSYALNERHKVADFYELPAARKFLEEKIALYKYIPKVHDRDDINVGLGLKGCLMMSSPLLLIFAQVIITIIMLEPKKPLLWVPFSLCIVFLFWAIIWMVKNLMAKQTLMKIKAFTNKFSLDLEQLKCNGDEDRNLQIPLDNLASEAIEITPKSELEEQNYEDESIIEFITYIETIHHLARMGKNTFFYMRHFHALNDYASDEQHRFVNFYKLPVASKFSEEKTLLYKYIKILDPKYDMEADSGLAGCFLALSMIIIFAGIILLFNLKFFLTAILFGSTFLFWVIVWVIRISIARHKLIKLDDFTNTFYFELEHLKYYGDDDLYIPLENPDSIKITPNSGQKEDREDP